MSLYIANGKIVDPSSGIEGIGSILIEDGTIAAVEFGEGVPPEGCTVIDASGKIVTPGLIDPCSSTIYFISASQMESTATTSFSAIHGRLLSKVQPFTMSSAAFLISAVSSTNAGGLPAPAPMPRLPLDNTAVTTPGPPVATRSGMSLCFIIMLLESNVGFSTVHAILSGPPISREASFSRLIA